MYCKLSVCLCDSVKLCLYIINTKSFIQVNVFFNQSIYLFLTPVFLNHFLDRFIGE